MELSLINQAASALCWPAHIQIVQIDGDAMSPTFKQGDYLAVDTLQRDVREGVYLLCRGGCQIVRRLHWPSNGSCLAACDNKQFSSESIPVEALAEAIIGRVIFVESRVY